MRGRVEHAARNMHGVISASANIGNSTLTVEFDENEFAMFPKNAAVSEFEPEAPFKDNQISK